MKIRRMNVLYFIKSIVLKLLVLIGVFSFSSCKKDSFAWNLKSRPEIGESYLKSNSSISFVCSSNLISLGNDETTEMGFCWSNSENPSILDNKIISEAHGIGEFDCEIIWSSTADVHIRSYAKNSVGIVYSNEIIVSWPGNSSDLPVVVTSLVDNIDFYTFSAKGLVISDGGMQLSGKGFIVSTETNPTFSNSLLIESTTNLDSLIADISGLTENTTYYLRSFATNLAGTGFGNILTVQTRNYYQIGETGPAGGFIFYSKLDNAGGWNFLESAPTNSSATCIWGPLNSPTYIDEGSIGSGFMNSNSITNILGNSNSFAVNSALNYQYNGYTDWYLPSRDELLQMREKLYLQNIANFSNGAYYWSSTEDNNFNQNAWVTKMSSNLNVLTLPKNGLYLIRAIRKF